MSDLASLSVGDLIPSFSREGTLHHWNRYAAIDYEFSDHHMEDAAGQREGFESAIGMAALIQSYMHSMLREWTGVDRGRVVAVDIQLRRPFLRGRTLVAGGKITGTKPEGAELFIELEIWADDDKGTRLVTGTAEVAVLQNESDPIED